MSLNINTYKPELKSKNLLSESVALAAKGEEGELTLYYYITMAVSIQDVHKFKTFKFANIHRVYNSETVVNMFFFMILPRESLVFSSTVEG